LRNKRGSREPRKQREKKTKEMGKKWRVCAKNGKRDGWRSDRKEGGNAARSRGELVEEGNGRLKKPLWSGGPKRKTRINERSRATGQKK